MLKIKNKKGFSLMEVLVVVAIVFVLTGVSFVAVQQYNRSMTKLKYDGYAREIFIAAQNHLSLLESLGYPGFVVDGEDADKLDADKLGKLDAHDETIRYFIVNVPGETSAASNGTVLSEMLPLGSVDETVRLGGYYIIRYQLKEAVVRDVFYWESTGNYSFTYRSSDYEELIKTEGAKNALMKYGDEGAVIGYYNGEAAALLSTGDAMKRPSLKVDNGDQLVVTITDPNYDGTSNHDLTLVIRGENGGYTMIPLKEAGGRVIAVNTDPENGVATYTVVLDDITKQGMGFADLDDSFVPGENITLQVLAEPKDELASPAYSAAVTTNSLFSDLDTKITKQADGQMVGQAGISSIRHLENLDRDVSGVEDIQFNKANQTADISWTGFADATAKLYSDSDVAAYKVQPEDVCIYYGDGNHTDPGCYLPVTPDNALSYNVAEAGETALTRTISGIKVNANGDAGLFGTLKDGSQIGNLELVDFDVTGTGNAGALAGSASGTAVTNVVVRNSKANDDPSTPTITGGGSVGGLIGKITGSSSVTGSAAALVVESTGGDAGGLIGTASGTLIDGCYSGGHTNDGAYYTSLVRDSETGELRPIDLINVSGTGNVGGLVGDAGNSVIVSSYSTCSAKGDTVGGLVGTASGPISSSYSTGLVRGTSESSTVGVFAGSSSGSCTDCACLDIAAYYDVSYDPDNALHAVGSGSSSGVTAMDESVETYEQWTPQSAPAVPYDNTLAVNYAGNYNFKTVEQLGYANSNNNIHYGDWPSPEQLVVNS